MNSLQDFGGGREAADLFLQVSTQEAVFMISNLASRAYCIKWCIQLG